MLEASIIIIGDEILGGFVDDTNSGWLAQQLRELSVPLVRVQTVPDDFGAIDEALSAELARSRPRLILTTGGIGSTPDDITYEAIAASLGLGVELDEQLAPRIKSAVAWTRSQGIEVDDDFEQQMMRMAMVPAGSGLIESDSVWVPGVRVDVDGGIADAGGATIVVLPGVPSQVRQIMRTGIAPLVEGRNPPIAVAESPHGYPESVLNPLFARLGADHPEVKVGSYPGTPMLVRLVGPPEAVQLAKRDVDAYLDELENSEAGRRMRDAWQSRWSTIDEDTV